MKIKFTLEPIGDDGFHIFCKVKINNSVLRALIDTGASKSVISNNIKTKLKLPGVINPNDNMISGIQPGKVDISFVKIEKLSLGTFVISNLVIGIVDLEHVNEQYDILGVKPFDFIIGGDILSKSNTIINYGNKTLEVNKN